MYYVSVRGHFDAAHKISKHSGKCSRLHGHRWEVEATFKFKITSPYDNMTIDFGVLKKNLNDVLNRFDHRYVNDVLMEENVTAELLASVIYDSLKPNFPSLYSVKVWETPENKVEFREEEG